MFTLRGTKKLLARLRMKPDVQAPPSTTRLGDWYADTLNLGRERLVLCVSELVTNAGQHAGTSARVTMELADRLLVTVEDTGTWSTPRARHEDHSAPDGRGLPLVAAFSDAMGHTQGANGSTVWFEMVREDGGT